MAEIINSVTDISPKALGELKAWLEPWFPHSATGGALQWEDVGAVCGPGVGLTHDLLVVIDGGGVAITTGIKGDMTLDFACTITGWTLLADQTGSVVIDIWKDIYANYPPTVADTITASAKPTLSSVAKNHSTTLTGWTTAFAAGDTLRFNVDSASTVQRVTLALKLVT